MRKQVFVCPNCNNSSTFVVEANVSLYARGIYPSFENIILRCDVCGEITYKIIKIEKISQGQYVPSELKTEEKFQYPFGYLYLEEDLPKTIKNFYIEAYNCFKIGALRGSASMCRATISAICDDRKVTGEDLKERINNLPLSQRLQQVAKNIKWVGDKTLHNVIDWSQADWNKNTIEEVLGFISRIIDDLYTQERKANELNSVVSKAEQGRDKK